MAWSASKIFISTIEDALESTVVLNIEADNIKAALFNDTITPSQTVASASTAYGAGVWASGGTFDASGWPAVGRQITQTSTVASNVYTFDGADTVSANGTTTITAAFGCLVYNDTLTTPVADQGICYNYFGGTNSVTSGTFTVVWNASGIFALTL